MRPAKLHTQARHHIARAYFAGAKPCELAEEYGQSQAFIIATARWFEKRLMERQRKTAAMRMRQFQAMAANRAARKEVDTFRIVPLNSAEGRELGIMAVRQQGKPSMPYVSIQHRPASQ